MALKVELKPGERIILGQAVVENGGHRAQLFIEGDVPVLREKDILTADGAGSPARRIYLAVQLMYLGGDMAALEPQYRRLADDFRRAAPSAAARVAAIDNAVLTGSLYKALKEAKALIAYEGELIAHVQPGSTGLRADRKADGPSA